LHAVFPAVLPEAHEAHALFAAPEEYLLLVPHETQDLPSDDEYLPAAHGVLYLVPPQL